jgi:uncharacterized membrane protein YphA (DoxX/SURF4 family)
MIDRRRIVGSFAVLALVFLRLVIGWHFFGEGTKKLQYDRTDGAFHLAFSADTELLDKAKGPLADWYFKFVPGGHDWRTLLATPRENVPPTADETAEKAKWVREYNARRAEAAKKKELTPVEFPPSAPYHKWAMKIADDWRAVLEKVKKVQGLTDAQKQQAEKALHDRLETLSAYLEGEEEDMTTYRHELFRLKNWRATPEASGVPFVQSRIATKNTETGAKVKAWRAQVAALDAGYYNDLDHILTPEQRAQEKTVNALHAATTDPSQERLDKLNIVVATLIISVGVCLLLGFFTRLAATAGALFLLGVICSQPFWISDAVPTINQCIEFAGLLVLAGTGAGRWFGLDYLTYLMFQRNRQVEVVNC